MAIYTNLKEVKSNKHGMFESSRLKATVVGHLYDAIVREGEEAIDVDNGVAIKIGEFTGNGLQEVYATIAKAGDRIAVTGTPALIKDAFTSEQAEAYHFYNPAGKPAKTYEVVDEDIFAVAEYQIVSGDVVVGNYVTVDGNGAWVATDEEPDKDAYGFVGKIHSIAVGNFYNMVRILAVQNKQI